jgi:putative DNA base modification enzyme with NMAD domain
MKIFSYVVLHDFGFAPNPFGGICTLATCKPQIRRTGHVGDWIVGTGSAQRSLAGRLVYAMRVSETLTFNDYWHDPRFAGKVPRVDGALKHVYGDNIYHQDESGHWQQADSRHSLADGSANPGHVRIDTSTDRVLIGAEFSYFGADGPQIPADLRSGYDVDLVLSGRGHRCLLPADLVTATLAWLGSLERGLLGRPAGWPAR